MRRRRMTMTMTMMTMMMTMMMAQALAFHKDIGIVCHTGCQVHRLRASGKVVPSWPVAAYNTDIILLCYIYFGFRDFL
jgi:hypothetical protein